MKKEEEEQDELDREKTQNTKGWKPFRDNSKVRYKSTNLYRFTYKRAKHRC